MTPSLLQTVNSSMAREKNLTSKNQSTGSKLKHSRSLVISPNLDALLEFEERHRGAISASTSPTRLLNDLPPSTPASLPPPPRGPRGSKSLPACKVEPPAVWGVTQKKHMPGTPSLTISSSESNPYINPAPTLKELLAENSQLIDVDVGSEDGRQFASGDETLLGSHPSDSRGGRRVSTHQGSFSKLTGTGLKEKEKLRKIKIQTSFDDEVEQAFTFNSHGQGIGSLLPPSPCEDSMFNFLNLSSPTDQKSHSADHHHSFFSPTQPDAVFSKLINDANVRNSPTLRSAPGSPKSPLRTTPKTLFNSTSFINKNCRKEPHSGEYSLPPTTNFLGTNERAELVRKTRKLAYVFGQTPEAGVLLNSMELQQLTVLATSQNVPSRRYSLPLTKSGDSIVADATKLHSPVSFIDLSDEDDTLSAIIPAPPSGRRRRSVSSFSEKSFSENISPEDQAEEERRRKREKLAKLHRFLGSQVPASLALGLDDPDNTLPPEGMSPLSTGDNSSRKIWAKRTSSYVAESPCPWTEVLGDREKAINVKRAQKMEKVFGVVPPQTLYHTRHTPSPTSPSVVDSPIYQRNPNRTAYTKNKTKSEPRPGTSESSQDLLAKDRPTMQDFATAWSTPGGKSKVYSHYQHSLNSVQDILDRDDKASLAELHQYLSNNEYSPTSPTSPLFQFTQWKDRRASNASSTTKSDRRRSLPARTSTITISSEFSVTSPKPDLTDFQLRRRRAAKLTHFFGVDYRELINDVLESIESGLEHERKRGTLQADEVEDLLLKLRELKIKRRGIF